MPSDTKRQLPHFDEQLDAIGSGRFQIVVLATLVLFIISDGMELVVTNVTWGDLPKEEWGLEDSFRSILVSTAFLGFVFGSSVGGIVGDVYGRKIIIFWHGVIFIPASILSALSQSKYELLATRFFVGISMGLILPTSVSMMTEFSPSATRGRMVIMLPGIAYCTGQALVLAIGIVLIGAFENHECTSCGWWRGMMAAGVIPDIIALTMAHFYVPESPRFLLLQGKVDEVERILLRIAKTNGKEFDPIFQRVGSEVNPIAHEKLVPPLLQTLWSSLVEMLHGHTAKDLSLIVTIWCLVGVPMFTLQFIFPLLLEHAEGAHLSSLRMFEVLIVYTLTEYPAVLITAYAIDHPYVGRQWTVAFAAAATVPSALLCAITVNMSLGWLVASNLLLRFCVVAPYEAMYVYAAETLPTSHRNKSLSSGNSATKIVAVLVPLLAQSLLDLSPICPFLLAATAAFCAAVGMLYAGREPPIALDDVVTEPEKVLGGLGEGSALIPPLGSSRRSSLIPPLGSPRRSMDSPRRCPTR
mmetsp:Transcript_36443/g.74819  ORF Transcript_36443/g.74819 Transcript_36443/m.74819 type:complete len:526 (-) Transcript_36443:316-1893(-)